MNVSRGADGNIEIEVTLDELSWFGQALNECWGGFRLKDFTEAIGVEREIVLQLLDQIVAMYPATLGGQK